jgi:hypothetical protein
MKRLLTLTLVAVFGFTNAQASGFSKNSTQLNALGSAWKTQQAAPKQDKNDLTIVYGGEDLDPGRPTLAAYTVGA